MSAAHHIGYYARRLAAAVTIATVSLAAAVAGVWIADREPPIVVYSSQAVEPVVERGGMLKIEYDAQRTRRCSYTVSRQIIDNEGSFFVVQDFVVATTEPLIRETLFVEVDVPKRAAPGPAVYRSTVSYVCNPLNVFWPINATNAEVRFAIR